LEKSVGNVYQEGHEDECLVQGFSHCIRLPCDIQSGQPTGQRRHYALRITKTVDKSSPLIFKALTGGERLLKVELKLYRTSAQGLMEHYYTFILEDAIIVNIRTYMPNCQNPANAYYTHMEDVDFTYRKLTKNHEVSCTSESDDWRRPRNG
jgi:type VI secretion system secreted protein Hcp